MPATLILVTGRSASGKTRLAAQLSDALRVPLVGRDNLKEILFDTLGTVDRDWSMKLGRASFVLLDYIAEAQLKAGNSIILETPLKPEFENAKFQAWQTKYGFQAVQIICDGDSNVLFERFKQRAHGGDRHAGHRDAESLEEFQEVFHSPVSEQRINIESTAINVDTTDFANVDYEAICMQVNDIVNSA